MAPAFADPMDRLPTGLKLFVWNLQSLTPVKLNNSNYPSWSATIRANLMAHHLLGFVNGSEPAPPSLLLDKKVAAPAKDEPPSMKPNQAYETWMIVDAQTRACLLAIVSPTFQTHIHTLPLAAAIWEHLDQRLEIRLSLPLRMLIMPFSEILDKETLVVVVEGATEAGVCLPMVERTTTEEAARPSRNNTAMPAYTMGFETAPLHVSFVVTQDMRGGLTSGIRAKVQSSGDLSCSLGRKEIEQGARGGRATSVEEVVVQSAEVGPADFMLWQCTIQDYLVQQGLDLALQDEKPSDIKESEWSTIQKKAVSTIRLALSPQIKVTVLKETSPKKLWETLESKFASKTLTNRLMMRMDLYSLKMEEGGRTTLRLDEVTTALKESQRMMGGEESSGDSHLLAAVSVEKERKKKSDQLWRRSQLRDMSTVRCYYCEKLGHTKNGCPELKEDLQILKEKKGKSKEASSANWGPNRERVRRR
ncbi:unnamed protein product [Cuscuta campestris]|uniref:CCHC-type domain-containing protein n=1 Tax=Cuscuta campestris TaxID=132261 RepID=A0A484KX71_9ASTE|nr:unnamed protein product [Cuscuta campestris]